VIDRSGLSAEEVRNYFDQLEGLCYIMKGIKVSGADFKLMNMTKEGLLSAHVEVGLLLVDTTYYRFLHALDACSAIVYHNSFYRLSYDLYHVAIVDIYLYKNKLLYDNRNKSC
jgi:hypothetical protein